ncbi:hypothetical protein BP6252_11260 [Coleophoma cylindrospora]|uniref:Zn(2)-C6 fungal-type domain-containing protein n=1 Tax=Coleophoma cylindrospora TaxID=1849047 RepID=A0A3D8QPI7_9HELO|nr:hypothetical protein BP6252_11260 [Coleophoma cylindrospora]
MAAGKDTKSVLSLYACVSCKDRKRRCDRVLPQCSRCERLRNHCKYESRATAHLEDVRQTVLAQKALVHKAQPKIDDDDARIHTKKRPANNTPELYPVSLLLSAILQDDSDPLKAPQMKAIISQIQQLIETYGFGIQRTTNHYFKTLAGWLPIIAPGEIQKEINALDSKLSLETSFLILCMCLIVQVRSPEQQTFGEIYSTAKSLFLVLSSGAGESLRVLQGGVLIALFEHGNAKSKVSAITLSICSRICTGLALSQAQHETEDTETSRAQWAILILQRTLDIELDRSQMKASGFVPPEPPLPVDSDYWSYTEAPYSDERHADSPMIVQIGVPGSFLRTVEAVQLLAKVEEFISKSVRSEVYEKQEAKMIDDKLQGLLHSLYEQATHGVEHCCFAIALCIR